MKKLLLLLIPVLAITGVASAQDEGYNWYFGTAGPTYPSSAAIAGSAGSYPLTTVFDIGGSIDPLPAQFMPLCGSSMDVGLITKNAGLTFSNSPQFINGTYTIEMVIELSEDLIDRRLVGFTDLAGVDGGNGIYVDGATGGINFYSTTVFNNIRGAGSVAVNTTYDLMFVRDGATKIISYYNNGVLIDTYTDTDDLFIPQVANSNIITFLKDNNGDDPNGTIAKISILNKAVSQAEVNALVANICSPGFVLSQPDYNPQGYQWAFDAPAPYVSTPAKDASPGSYTLSELGAGAITPVLNTDIIGLGTSCLAGINVGQFAPGYGLEYIDTPRTIRSSYTLEMVVNFASVGADLRVLGFTDLAGANGGEGIYFDPAGQIDFYTVAHGDVTFAGSPILANTWYHLLFTRDGTTNDVSYYQNGVLVAVYPDTDSLFMPLFANSYKIAFLKDNGVDEPGGLLAKLAVFNHVLNAAQIQQRFDNICNVSDIILPVSLKNFNAKKDGRQVDLTWTTVTEQNNRGFEIQRSSNGSAYAAIGFVNGIGNSTLEHNYSFVDESPAAGKNYYRLKQVDLDNRAAYSEIRVIDMSKDQQDVQVYPNPARTAIKIVNIKTGNLLSIFDSQGRFVFSKRATNSNEVVQVDKLSAGVYILQVTDDTGNKRSIRFSKF